LNASAPAAAFGHTFAWALALTALAVVPALLLAQGTSPKSAKK
jgi:hypothetical protein